MQGHYGYRLLTGKGGVSGHMRGMGDEWEIMLRGLPPGAQCFIYFLYDGTAIQCAGGKASAAGSMAARIQGNGTVFAAVEGQVAAWEEAAGDPGYFAACRVLEKLSAPPLAAEKETLPEIPIEKAEERGPEEKEEYSLRPSGSGEAVDTLPLLKWPGKAGALRHYFDICQPIMPFEAPGWRFVRVPSPLRGVGYCLVGRKIREDSVSQIAYALPGHPQRPPVPLPGYRYQMGLRGQGYWVFTERV